MDSLTRPTTTPGRRRWARRYGAAAPPAGPWNDTIATMLDHRSVRGYQSDPVPPGTLETMIAAAQSAATSSNMQLTSASPSPIKSRGKSWPRSPATRSTSSSARSTCAGRHVPQRPDFPGREGDLREHALARDLPGGQRRCRPRRPERRGGRRVARPQLRLYRRHAQRARQGARPARPAAQCFVLFGLCVGYTDQAAKGEVKPRLPRSTCCIMSAMTPPPRPDRPAHDAEMAHSRPARKCRPGPGLRAS